LNHPWSLDRPAGSIDQRRAPRRARRSKAMSKRSQTIMPLLMALVVLAVLAAHPAVAGSPAAAARPGSTPQSFTCVPTDLSICLYGGRFEVAARFAAPDGEAGNAHLVQLTDDSGYMWFFSSANVEVVAKVLNGCALNSKYWFFAGGLTNVMVVITITDSQTGDITQYHNLQGTAFQPIQDTSALPVCP
jgi:hypothetical protein